MRKLEERYKAPIGSGILHEILESYIGGLLAIEVQGDIERAEKTIAVQEKHPITGKADEYVKSYGIHHPIYKRIHDVVSAAPDEMNRQQKKAPIGSRTFFFSPFNKEKLISELKEDYDKIQQSITK